MTGWVAGLWTAGGRKLVAEWVPEWGTVFVRLHFLRRVEGKKHGSGRGVGVKRWLKPPKLCGILNEGYLCTVQSS